MSIRDPGDEREAVSSMMRNEIEILRAENARLRAASDPMKMIKFYLVCLLFGAVLGVVLAGGGMLLGAWLVRWY